MYSSEGNNLMNTVAYYQLQECVTADDLNLLHELKAKIQTRKNSHIGLKPCVRAPCANMGVTVPVSI